MEGFQDIGQRVVQAARYAVALHLYESVAEHTSAGVEASIVAGRVLRARPWQDDDDDDDNDNGGNGGRSEPTGGAGRRNRITELDVENSLRRPNPRLGDLVTDDERDGLMGLNDADAGNATGGGGGEQS